MRFLFEAAVMGGAPVFSLPRRGEALPAARLERFRDILNSTTNLILTEMEHGNSFEASVKKAQDRTQLGCGGIAETAPSFDVDGWDATVKVAAPATLLTLAPAIAAVASAGVDYPLKPYDIAREGIRGVTVEDAARSSALAPSAPVTFPSLLLNGHRRPVVS